MVDDPEAFLDRRCETQNGSPIHPTIVVRALLTGHVRRVVMDAPGCTLPGDWSQVDHNTEWHEGGRTDQSNRTVGCGRHNRVKDRERGRVRRDRRGRAYTLRPDGTIILPVGERPPDLTDDEMAARIRERLREALADRVAQSLERTVLS